MDNIDSPTHQADTLVDGLPDGDESGTPSEERNAGTKQIPNVYGFNPSLDGINTPVTTNGIGESARIPILDTNGLGWPGECCIPQRSSKDLILRPQPN
jgi:hypothetical protein